MKKWILLLSILFAFCAAGFVLFAPQSGYPGDQNDDPNSRASGANLIPSANQAVDQADSSNRAGKLSFQVTPTNSPLIPNTGRRIDSSVIFALIGVAILGLVMALLGLVLKK